MQNHSSESLDLMVSIQKRGILAKVKSKLPDFERENAMIVTIPLFSGTDIHTLKSIKDLSASGGLQSERDVACPAILSVIALSLSKGRRRKP
jgi:hypothetical protein